MSARPSEPPLAELPRLIEGGATGELVCVCPDVEVHVYLQSGRVAWATSSASQLRFSRELEKRGVETHVLREVLEHCRTARAPVGETLVAWGAASLDDVREALRLQIEDAVTAVAGASRGRTLFLRRGASGGADYDDRFTFTLAEVLKPVEVPREDDERRAREAELRAALPEVRWIGEHRDGQLWPARWPTPRHERIARHAFDGGADFLAMRLESELVVGLGLADDRGAVWLGLPPSTNVGATLAVLAEHVRPSYLPPAPRGPVAVGNTAPVARPAACPACEAVGATTLDRFAEVRCVLVVGAESPCVVCRTPGDVGEAQRVTREHSWLLSNEGGSGGCVCTVALGVDRTWWFAGDVADGSRRQVWIALDRAAAQGVGWALVATLQRQIDRAPCVRSEPSRS